MEEKLKEPCKNGYCADCNNNVCGKCCVENILCANVKECDDFHDWKTE